MPKETILAAIWRRIKGLFAKFYLWIFSAFFGWMIAIFVGLKMRKRMSHDNGIAGIGEIKIVDDPKFPPHPFFHPGTTYPARIRHASATFLDDAMSCIRSMSVKFSHDNFKSPFDIEMNTGEISLFWSAFSFLKFAQNRKEKWGIEYIDYYKKYPEGLKGAEVAIRRDPKSFHDLRYYAKTPFLYNGSDNIKRYAKYRIRPYEDIPETGIIEDPSAVDIGNQRILPHETRGRNYLKYEYEDRVKKQGAKYRMQIQTRIAQNDDDPEIFNNMVPWDSKAYPWHDLGIIEINETLDWKESTLTSFSLNHMPKGLGIIPAKSIYDYNSLNYMRSHSEIARKARLFSYKLFGFPQSIPNDQNRNSGDWSEIQKNRRNKFNRPLKMN